MPSPSRLQPPARHATLDEAAARRVVLLQAVETSPAPGGPPWTDDDRRWATRLAHETTAAGAAPERFIDDRARHALQRLAPRDAGVARLLQRRWWRGGWVPLALAAGLLAGLTVDAVGSGQRIDLLAPPVWAVVGWNLLVYVSLLLPLPHGLRSALARRLALLAAAGPPQSVPASFGALWLRQAWPLTVARAALLLHAAAAGLALGLIGGLYLRGLVLDYRAGWQSTFLDAAQVHAALAWLLAPAAAVSGIAVPDADALQALRVGPGTPPQAGAAPWIHLYASTLALLVVLPRALLAAGAGWRAGRLAQRLPLPLHEPYFQRLLRDRTGAAPVVQVWPHGATPAAPAVAGLTAWLGAAWGSAAVLHLAAATPYGSEDGAAAPCADGAALGVLLVDLSGTPEADAHGRLLAALRTAVPTLPLLLLADEAAFSARFAALPARVAERRAAWRQWAASQQLGFAGVDLARPDLAGAPGLLQAGLHAALQTAQSAQPARPA